MSVTRAAVVGSTTLRPTEAILGFGYSLLVDAQQTNGQYELMTFVIPAGLGPPLHVHENEDEHFLVSEGEFEVTVGDKTFNAPAGTFIHLPRGIPHTVRNVSTSLSTFLCWVVPGNLGAFFDALKQPWPEGDVYPPLLTPADIERVTGIARQYGIEFLA